VFDSEVSLRDLVSGASQQLSAPLLQKRIQLVNLIPDDLPKLRVDLPKAQKLFELILRDELANLQDNATVRFEASLAPTGDRLRLRIEDNGPGLPEESLKALFDPFASRGAISDEFGINLMGCYFIVHHHGGTISVEPGAENGLVFHIELPLRPDTGPSNVDSEEFLVRVMTNERLWERLLATA
jgi:signal transduction histidine kinase